MAGRRSYIVKKIVGSNSTGGKELAVTSVLTLTGIIPAEALIKNTSSNIISILKNGRPGVVPKFIQLIGTIIDAPSDMVSSTTMQIDSGLKKAFTKLQGSNRDTVIPEHYHDILAKLIIAAIMMIFIPRIVARISPSVIMPFMNRYPKTFNFMARAACVGTLYKASRIKQDGSIVGQSQDKVFQAAIGGAIVLTMLSGTIYTPYWIFLKFASGFRSLRNFNFRASLTSRNIAIAVGVVALIGIVIGIGAFKSKGNSNTGPLNSGSKPSRRNNFDIDRHHHGMGPIHHGPSV
jgi:hypothetical protein